MITQTELDELRTRYEKAEKRAKKYQLKYLKLRYKQLKRDLLDSGITEEQIDALIANVSK